MNLMNLFVCKEPNLHQIIVFLSSVLRERATAHRTLRRQDKKMKELQSSIEEERKQAEVYKSDVSRWTRVVPDTLQHWTNNSRLHHFPFLN